MTAAIRNGHLHAALLYGSPEELTAAVVPFLAGGLAAGEAVVLACREEHTALLTEALGTDDRVLLLDRDGVYTRSAHAVATYRRVVHRQVGAGARGVRLVGEVPVDHGPPGWDEWHRYEAVCNVALAPLPLSSVCAYDIRELTGSVRDRVEQTHPALLAPGGHLSNDGYVDPATVLRTIPGPPLDRAADVLPALELAALTDVTGLPELRARVRAALDGPWWQEQWRSDFAAAVGEVLVNAFGHGRPPVTVRLWATPTQLACTVTDCGDGFDDPLAGYVPPGTDSSPAGAGLWLVRQTCDAFEATRTPTGFTVRLGSLVPGPGSPPPSAFRPAHPEPAAARADRARARANELARRFS